MLAFFIRPAPPFFQSGLAAFRRTIFLTGMCFKLSSAYRAGNRPDAAFLISYRVDAPRAFVIVFQPGFAVIFFCMDRLAVRAKSLQAADDGIGLPAFFTIIRASKRARSGIDSLPLQSLPFPIRCPMPLRPAARAVICPRAALKHSAALAANPILDHGFYTVCHQARAYLPEESSCARFFAPGAASRAESIY